MRIVVETRVSVYAPGEGDDRQFIITRTVDTGDNPAFLRETVDETLAGVGHDLLQSVAQAYPEPSRPGNQRAELAHHTTPGAVGMNYLTGRALFSPDVVVQGVEPPHFGPPQQEPENRA